jgi:PTS system nitrogen regulatory IIA component
MQVVDILHPRRVAVARDERERVRTKSEALHRLAQLLSSFDEGLSVDIVEGVLVRREELQSTGVGGGVAIPHASVEGLDRIIGAVLLCPEPIGFDAIDGMPVSIVFAIVGPRKSTGEHLKTLAKVSRLLRDDDFRARLVAAGSGEEAFGIIATEEEARR